MSAGAPDRHLVVRIRGRRNEFVLLRFPPGLVLRDVLRDPHDPLELKRLGARPYMWMRERFLDPLVADERLLSLLRDAGASRARRYSTRGGIRLALERLCPRIRDGTASAYASDCLDVNSRIARQGSPCPVSLDEYMMHTTALLHAGDGSCLFGEAAWFVQALIPDGAAVIGRVAVWREDLGRFRWLAAADALAAGGAIRLSFPALIPCRLHGRECEVGAYFPHFYMAHALDRWWLWAHVPLLPDDADRAGHDRVAWARDIARRVLDTLPDEAWSSRHMTASPDTAAAIAYSAAETCEEFAMLRDALQSCRSARQMAATARARDAAWEVGRALERAGAKR